MANFNLKSGNTTPFKEMGSSPVENPSPNKVIVGTGIKLLLKGAQKLYKGLKKFKNKPKKNQFKYSVELDKSGKGGYIRGKEGSYIPFTNKYTKKGSKVTQDFSKKMSLNTPEAKEAWKHLVK